MLVDNQAGAATALGKNTVFVQLVVRWCATDDNPGIQSESVRLLAWLVKNSRSPDVMEIVVARGGLPHLAAMVASEHAVMQNEALIALTLIFTHLDASRLKEAPDASRLVDQLVAALKPEDSEVSEDSAATGRCLAQAKD
jgi:hypothetical protein